MVTRSKLAERESPRKMPLDLVRWTGSFPKMSQQGVENDEVGNEAQPERTRRRDWDLRK